MATQLGVINDALSMLGEGGISSTEFAGRANEPARVMADAWPDAVDECLSAAPWIFASRIVAPMPEGTDGTYQDYAAPGYQRAFPVPDDHLRTNWLRETAFGGALPIQFHYQDGFWHTQTASLVASYVSHEFRPPETWTPLFAKAVAGYLAWTKGTRIRPQADENALRLKFDALMDRAQSVDASEKPFAWPASGRLVRSRQGFRGQYGSRQGNW